MLTEKLEAKIGVMVSTGAAEPIGTIPPAEAEERCYAMPDEPAMAA